MSYTQLHEPWAEEPYPTPLRAKRYGEEYVNKLYIGGASTWKTPHSCEVKWKNRTAHELKATFASDDRSPLDVLNAQIDKVYDEIGDLVARRSDQADPDLEKRIVSLFQRLRELQRQEGDLVREATRTKLDGPIAAGLDILKRADEIRARYGIVAAANTSTPSSNNSET